MTKEEAINKFIKDKDVDTNQISDGYHTFGELYKHRIALWMALCKSIHHRAAIYGPTVWRSMKHSDGTFFDGWFVLGVTTFSKEQLTYHLPLDKWEECGSFTQTLERAPEWDGHSSDDVLQRLSKL